MNMDHPATHPSIILFAVGLGLMIFASVWAWSTTGKREPIQRVARLITGIPSVTLPRDESSGPFYVQTIQEREINVYDSDGALLATIHKGEEPAMFQIWKPEPWELRRGPYWKRIYPVDQSGAPAIK